jgi:UDP-N-acetylmuramyl pentapeptide synthase
VIHQPLAPAGAPGLVIEVEDTTRALQDLAREVRRRSGATVVAITGSAGKTTTKEITARFLGRTLDVFRNAGNLNNHIGLPLSLLELRTRPQVAVVELGMNHAGEIRTLVRIAEPEIRVWTNVGDAHLGFFDSVEAVADAKAEILEDARPDDVLVANADDPRVMARAAVSVDAADLRDRRDADVRARTVAISGSRAWRPTSRRRPAAGRLRTRLLGAATSRTCWPPLAVGCDCRRAARRRCSRRPRADAGEPPRRALRLPGGVTLIDDSYNASPAALRRRSRSSPPRPAAPGRSRCSARCWSSARPIACTGVRPPAGRVGSRRAGAVGGDARRGAGRGGGGRPAWPDRRDARNETARRPPDARCAWCGRATSCWSRGRAASGPNVVVERLKEEFA